MKQVIFGVSGNFLENPLRKWPKICMLLYPDHLKNWLDYDHSLSIFLFFALFWLSEMGQIWGFRAFWSCSVDLGFLGIIWKTCRSKCRGGSRDIFPMLCVQFCLVLDKFCAINPMIFSGIRQSICELKCWWYCHIGGPFKSSRNIKWASNESWMKN